jgi:hypothetical protein
MRLPYAAALLVVMGTAQAATSITFAKGEPSPDLQTTQCLPPDDKCTDLQGAKVDVSDEGCHKGRADSKSISFSEVDESQALCLEKFKNDDCKGSGVRQDFKPDSESMSQHLECGTKTWRS